MMKYLILGTLLLVSSIFAKDVPSYQSKYDARPPFIQDWDNFSKELRLTNKQQSKVLSINKSFDKKYARYSKKIHPLREKLHAERLKKSPSFSKSREFMTQLAHQQTNRHVDHLKHRARISKLLTKDQQALFLARINKYPNPDFYPDPDKYPNPDFYPDPDKAPAPATKSLETPTQVTTDAVATPAEITAQGTPNPAVTPAAAPIVEKKLTKKQLKAQKKEEAKKKRAKIKQDITKAATKEIEKLAQKSQ